jgi:recombination protein RecT
LIYRAGAVSSVVVEAVRANDHFRWVPGEMTKPVHEPPAGNWFTAADRGAVVGAYAYAIMRDGAVSEVVIVDDERIARAIQSSPTGNSSYSPWKTDYRAMVLKTAAHDLTKWVPTSPEFAREQLRVQRDVALEHAPVVNVTGLAEVPLEPPADPAVVDAEIVDPEPASGEA